VRLERLGAGLAALLLVAIPTWADARACAGSVTVTNFKLMVQPAKETPWRPVRKVNAIRAGYTIRYEPVRKPSDKDAAIALVIVPHPKPTDDEASLIVLPARKASSPTEWEVPVSASVLTLVYGPNGLDQGKVRNLVKKDRELIAQLADYAEQTAMVEALVDELSRSQQNGRSLDGALAGLSARGVGNFQQINRAAPVEQQAMMLMRTVNPALSGIDPLAPSPDMRTAQTVTLAASVAGLFFSNTVGLAAGSAMMFQNLRTILWPGTDFRSSFAQLSDSNDLSLCAKGGRPTPRTRPAYLWAMRVPNASAPVIAFDGVTHLPAGARMMTPVRFHGKPDWPSVAALDDWRLVATDQSVVLPIKVQTQADRGALAIEVPDVEVPEGPYRLTARWDWQQLDVGGEVRVEKPAPLRNVEIPTESLDRLVEGAGSVEITLLGPDFQFLDNVELAGGDLEGTRPQEFILPQGRGAGVQERARVRLDTKGLKHGDYRLRLTQLDGSSADVAFRLLPPHPTVKIPLKANLGEKAQTLTLEGSGLERIEAIGASVLSQSKLGKSEGGRRAWTVALNQEAKAGARAALRLKVEGLGRELELDGALEILGPRPRIVDARVSLPSGLGIGLRDKELPADWNLTLMMRAANASQPVMDLACTESSRELAPQRLRAGEKTTAASMDAVGEGGLFLSLTPGLVGQPGCDLVVRIETVNGVSDPYPLGRVVRLPRIERFQMTGEEIGDSVYAAYLEGYHLETIERTGWEGSEGYPVEALPSAAGGESHRQVLKIGVPWPSPRPKAPLHVWLRGEPTSRATQAAY
jgi:hypothetical protein